MSLTAEIRSRARDLGFDLVGVTPAGPAPRFDAFRSWLAAGYHGEMAYLARRAAERAGAGALAPGARSLIMLAANYNPGPPPPEWNDPAFGRIARYAWAPDYHDAIKAQLYDLDRFIRARTGRSELGKACVDTAPLLERDYAMQARVGFTGKNSCLIAPQLGSWLFLSALLVPQELEYDPSPAPDPLLPGVPAWILQTGPGTCGACTRCMVACPTNAFAGPYVLDARRCISYLTIELRGPIPRDLRPLMRNWIFGCDVCQEVCPYNREAPLAAWDALAPDRERAAPRLLDLLVLDEAGFRARYRGTPVLRTKRRGLVRNACIAAGNWGSPEALPALSSLLADPEPILRGHAAWALGRIGGSEAARALERFLAAEPDPWARAELAAAVQDAAR